MVIGRILGQIFLPLLTSKTSIASTAIAGIFGTQTVDALSRGDNEAAMMNGSITIAGMGFHFLRLAVSKLKGYVDERITQMEKNIISRLGK